MPTVGFELSISPGEQPKTYTLDRVATGTGEEEILLIHNITELFRITSLYIELWLFHIYPLPMYCVLELLHNSLYPSCL